jgi:hypothetical protein
MKLGGEIKAGNVFDFFSGVTHFIDRDDLLEHCGYSFNYDEGR